MKANISHVCVLCCIWAVKVCETGTFSGRSGTIECMWDVDVFGTHFMCTMLKDVSFKQLCFGSIHKLTKPFCSLLFSGSISNVHIDTHKHRRRERQKPEKKGFILSEVNMPFQIETWCLYLHFCKLTWLHLFLYFLDADKLYCDPWIIRF